MYKPTLGPDCWSKVPSQPNCDHGSYPPGLSGQRGGPEPFPLHPDRQNPVRDASSGPQTLGGFSCAREQTSLFSLHVKLHHGYSAITSMNQVWVHVCSHQVIHLVVFAIKADASSAPLPQLEAGRFLNLNVGFKVASRICMGLVTQLSV